MDSIMTFIVLHFDPIMRILIVLLVVFCMVIAMMWADKQQREQERLAIESGDLKILSQVDYNREFGIENDFALDEDEPLPPNVIPIRHNINRRTS